MKKTTIHVKTEKDIKKEAQKTAKKLGFSLSAVVNAQLRQFIRNKKLSVSLQPKMNTKLEETLSKVEKDLKKGKNISKGFDSEKEIRSHLDE